ncbi:protein SGT1 homolog [Daktulosphaira vitifoliae]|uniref:protein SGT1 homolog n=1 Tax=Daktulosphaira vitifoliae TaxID=58002 RepID=UPI0021AA3E38|nr:protein SGT1 homolog [Daktulosphaira vitifoliae]XP_050525282.1 protein SGT1 homolog [Daktulosphaira vitifoliae]XP_050525283.1 protein SGT1 homolog [Daktulosphaira vitifoliae]
MANKSEENQAPIKKDWYQSETHVYVTILGKHSCKEDCTIKFSSNNIIIQAKYATGQQYTLNIHLFKQIIPDNCNYKVLSSKLEVVLAKAEAGRWESLECVAIQNPSTSSNQERNWDKVVNEMTKDDDDNDVNSLFKKIYSEGSDEVRKAMNKSFLESGGTVLSTNWKDVAKDKVDIKPPEGMEWKKWDQ